MGLPLIFSLHFGESEYLMKDILEIISDHLQPERLHQLKRALEVTRDCAKEAMVNARNAGNDRATKFCLHAYQAISRQITTLEQTLMRREGD